MGSLVCGTHLNIASGDPFLFSGKRLLHCTEAWTERRVVAIAFTIMGSFSISPELDSLLGAPGFVTPDSLEVDFFTRELIGPGQLKQTILKPKTLRPEVWQTGKLKHGDPTTLVLSDSEDDHRNVEGENDLGSPFKHLKPTCIDSSSSQEDSQMALFTVPWPHEEAAGG